MIWTKYYLDDENLVRIAEIAVVQGLEISGTHFPKDATFLVRFQMIAGCRHDLPDVTTVILLPTFGKCIKFVIVIKKS